MGVVIPMPTPPPRTVKPYSKTYEHAGQKYTCTCDPNAPPEQRWVWTVNYVRVYRFAGACPSMDAAASRARRLIHTQNKLTISWDEAE